MKAMTVQEYNSVLEFIQEWHPFINLTKDRSRFPKMSPMGLSIKYVNGFYDTRTKEIYKIVLYVFGSREIDLNVMNIMDGDHRNYFISLYDYVMAYLKGEIRL